MCEQESKCEKCGGEAHGLYLCPACSMEEIYGDGDCVVWAVEDEDIEYDL